MVHHSRSLFARPTERQRVVAIEIGTEIGIARFDPDPDFDGDWDEERWDARVRISNGQCIPRKAPPQRGWNSAGNAG